MLWILLGILLIFVSLTEATVTFYVWHDASTRLQLCLKAANLQKAWHFRLFRTAHGHRLLRTDKDYIHPLQPTQLPQEKDSLLPQALLHENEVRRFLLSHLHLDRLEGLLLLRTGDAAHSAILSGTLQSLLSCIPATRMGRIALRVLPEFFREHSTIRLRCIIRFRLGTIILTAGMLLFRYLKRRHPTESEALNYGTSHR